MIELRNSAGALDFSRVTPDLIAELSEPLQRALLHLIDANEVKLAAMVRGNVARRRLDAAIADEEVKRAAREDASSPIPFEPIVAKLEADLGRSLSASEMQAATEQHAIRVREHREAEARAASIASYNANH